MVCSSHGWPRVPATGRTAERGEGTSGEMLITASCLLYFTTCTSPQPRPSPKMALCRLDRSTPVALHRWAVIASCVFPVVEPRRALFLRTNLWRCKVSSRFRQMAGVFPWRPADSGRVASRQPAHCPFAHRPLSWCSTPSSFRWPIGLGSVLAPSREQFFLAEKQEPKLESLRETGRLGRPGSRVTSDPCSLLESGLAWILFFLFRSRLISRDPPSSGHDRPRYFRSQPPSNSQAECRWLECFARGCCLSPVLLVSHRSPAFLQTPLIPHASLVASLMPSCIGRPPRQASSARTGDPDFPSMTLFVVRLNLPVSLLCASAACLGNHIPLWLRAPSHPLRTWEKQGAPRVHLE
ncbi:hypothetical protein MAPG_09962 [Magnaporthiopsis poae ATCC 64411]|uniref:Uncharacterized protein n=1 Tax=Magnaporthiopsis poae (strain ATCC 64411 / 73-15) TaxID=644358 RepID=A0A0C4EBB5_MAGP6|nr:hypothetical protein MAPG_09962 [Magnaporthiopsis poae ATCC 64411]